MNNIQEYINSTIKFVNSLVFKFELHRLYMNKLWKDLYNYTPNDPTEEKYYLNLAGLKAPHDPVVYIYSPVESTYIEFNKEYLNNNPDVKTELLTYGDSYKRLVSENPYMVTYINGCLNDLNIEDIINANDGDILAYNKNYIGVNEINILNDIEEFVKKILYSYNVKEYTIDDFYIHSLTSTIYSNLPSFILAKKISNLLTYKADKFNILSHITSYGGIEQNDYDFMNLSSLLWLYGNRNYIKTNVGKNEVLKSILDNVYASNQIGVNILTIKDKTPSLIEDNLNDVTKSIYTKDKVITTLKGNTYGNVGDEYNIDDIINIEKNNGYIFEDISDNNKFKQEIMLLNDNDLLTKDLMFNKSELILNKYKTTIELLVPVFLLTTQNETITSTILYQNPENNKTYTFNKNQLIMLYLYGILVYLNLDTNVRIDQVDISFDYTKSISFEDIVDELYLKDKVKPYYDYVVTLKKDIPNVTSMNQMGELVSILSDILFKIKTVNSNIDDMYLLHDFNIIVNSLFPSSIMTIPNEGMTIYEYVKTYYPEMIDLTSDMAGYLIKDISKRIFKIEIDEMEILKNIFNKYLRVGNVYKSYTVKYIYDATDSTDISTDNIPLKLGHNIKSYIKIKESRFKRYNDIHFDSNTITYPLNDIGPIGYEYLINAKVDTYIDKPKLKVISKSIMMLNDTITLSIMRYVDKLYPDIHNVASSEINNRLTVYDNELAPSIETYEIKEKSLTSNNQQEDYIREIEPLVVIHK